MIPSLRRALLPLAIAAAASAGAAAGWRAPGPPVGAAPPARTVPFDAALRAAAAPLRPLPAGLAFAERARHVLDDVERQWAATFARAGERYVPARLVALAPAATEACGVPVSAFAGLYCGDGRLVVQEALDAELRAREGAARADAVLVRIVAHEVGHHVQRLRGVRLPGARHELQAECLAGVWAGAAGVGEAPIELFNDLDVAGHGDARAQMRWFHEGRMWRRPGACTT